MDLAKLVDFEVQLHRDEDTLRSGNEASLRARDARFGAQIAEQFAATADALRSGLANDRALRAKAATAWLSLVQAEGEHDGERSARALRRATWVITLVLLLLGAGAARTALAYDGKEPVNVFVFLGVLVLPQVVLLILMLWAMARGNGGLLGGAITALARTRWLRGAHTATLGTLGARLSLHQGVERWHVFGLALRGAIAFNVGALTATLALVALTDLAFGWSTTLQVAADQVHTACRWIAAPWTWAWPDALPSAALVRDSQWVRLPGRFVSGASLPEAVANSGRWWSFLVAALATWGLLPRLLAAACATQRARRAQHAIAFDDVRCGALFDRLWPSTSSWQSPAPDAISLPASQRVGAHPQVPTPPALTAGATWLLCWGHMARASEDLAQRVRGATGTAPLGVLSVGGADLRADASAVQRLSEAKAQRVLLALAAGSQPTKDVLDLLRNLRARLGPRAHLLVTVASDHGSELANEELAGWRACLDRQSDPYLSLQRLEPSR